MKAAPFLLVGLLVTIAGCNRSNPAHSVFGPANLHVQEAICAGKVALIQGSASVHDACFSGDTNVVVHQRNSSQSRSLYGNQWSPDD